MKSTSKADIACEIDDEECTIEVYSWGYFTPAKLYGHPDTWCPEEGEPHEYAVLDKNGNEIELSERQHEDVLKEIDEYLLSKSDRD